MEARGYAFSDKSQLCNQKQPRFAGYAQTELSPAFRDGALLVSDMTCSDRLVHDLQRTPIQIPSRSTTAIMTIRLMKPTSSLSQL
jgi:hypothetical protein